MTETTKEHNEQELLAMGYDEEQLEEIIEMQDLLANGNPCIVSITTDDEHLLDWLHDNDIEPFELEIVDFDIETYMVWVRDCDYGIQINECQIVEAGYLTDEEELERGIALLCAIGENLDQLQNVAFEGRYTYSIGGHEYSVVNDDERQEIAIEYIEDTLWAFNASFLAEMTDYDLLPVFEAMQKADMCESANEPIKCLVEKFSSIEKLVDRATSYDGYGHYLSNYHGNELEHGNFYIYKTN